MRMESISRMELQKERIYESDKVCAIACIDMDSTANWVALC